MTRWKSTVTEDISEAEARGVKGGKKRGRSVRGLEKGRGSEATQETCGV